MVFANVEDLLHMAGHGPYVWAAYGVTVLALLALVLLPLLEKRRLLREIAGRARRDAQRRTVNTTINNTANTKSDGPQGE